MLGADQQSQSHSSHFQASLIPSSEVALGHGRQRWRLFSRHLLRVSLRGQKRRGWRPLDTRIVNFMVISDQFGIWSNYQQGIAAATKTELETGHMATCVSPRASPRTATKGHSIIFCPPQQQWLRPGGGCSTMAQGSPHLPAPLGNKQKDAPQKPFGHKGSLLTAEVAPAESSACLLPNNVTLSVFPKDLIRWVQAGLQTPCAPGQLCTSSSRHPPTGADEAGVS